jgi:hypothetical protein
MNLLDLLTYLHDGAYPTWKSLILTLGNRTVKSLRLTHKTLAPELFPFLFTRIYISAHSIDLDVFRLIANHPTALRHVTELIWDDTRFDQWISGHKSYTDRLTTLTTTPGHIIRQDAEVVNEAYLFWASEASDFAENRAEDVDRKVFEEHVGNFTNLRSIVVLSRSRLTYVDPASYWDIWQTPRTRVWAGKSFSRYLLQPEPYKPSTGTTVHESEGIRPLKIIRGMARDDSNFKVGLLSLNSIGGGQSRAFSDNMVTSNRFNRRWHIDLQELTSRQPAVSKGKIALQLLLETQTEDVFHHSGVLEDSIDLLMMDTASNLESLIISNVCLDWFLDNATLAHTQTPYLRRLKSVRIEGGLSHDPTGFLQFLAQQTTVREIAFDGCHLDGTTWSQVLHNLRDSKVIFDRFELRPSRGKAQVFPSPIEQWVVSRIAFSDQIVPWLKRETEVFPLLC